MPSPDPPTLEQVVEPYLERAQSVNDAIEATRQQGQTTLLLNMIIRMQVGILVVGNRLIKDHLIRSQSSEYGPFLLRNIVTLEQLTSGALPLRGRREPLFWDNTALVALLPDQLRSMTQENRRMSPPSEDWTWYDALDQNEVP